MRGEKRWAGTTSRHRQCNTERQDVALPSPQKLMLWAETQHSPTTQQHGLLQPTVCVKHSPQEKRTGRISQMKIWLCLQSLEVVKLNGLSLFSGRVFYLLCFVIASLPSVTNWRWVMPSALKFAGQREVCQMPSLIWWDSHAWAGNQNQRGGRKEILNNTSEGSHTNWSGWREGELGMFCEDQRNSNKLPSAFSHVLSSQYLNVQIIFTVQSLCAATLREVLMALAI